MMHICIYITYKYMLYLAQKVFFKLENFISKSQYPDIFRKIGRADL